MDKRFRIINYTSDGNMDYVNLDPPGDPDCEYSMSWSDWGRGQMPDGCLFPILHNAHELPCRMSMDGSRVELLVVVPAGKGMQVGYYYDPSR